MFSCNTGTKRKKDFQGKLLSIAQKNKTNVLRVCFVLISFESLLLLILIRVRYSLCTMSNSNAKIQIK